MLTSHTSGEFTTLLWNSVENLCMSDIFLKDPKLTKCMDVVVRRVVGNNMLAVCQVKNVFALKAEGLESIKETVFKHVAESGHVVNPQKASFVFG